MKSQISKMNEFDAQNDFFIALAASSTTGKTQMAFSISSKIPLYFVRSGCQVIYDPFISLSSTFFSCAFNDNKNMLKEVIDADDFDSLKTCKSETLGLLSLAFSQ